jgi:hypothetical protein
MIELTYDIAVGILTTVVIAIGAYSIRPLQKYAAIKKKGGLVGEWYAATAPNSPKMHNVVVQRVKVTHALLITELFSRAFGLLDLECSQCLLGYNWKATASISMDRYLNGEWWSIRQGAHQRGTFTLVIGPQGDYCYGYAAGFNDVNQVVLKKWVLGKSKEALLSGFEMLSEHPSTCDLDSHEFFRDAKQPERRPNNQLNPTNQGAP